MTLGVLALQGDFREHISLLRALDLEAVEVRLPQDLEGTQGLIVPGGESTALRKLLRYSGLDRALVERAATGYGVYGTCAGMILLAKRLTNDPGLFPLGLIDVEVCRNAYGRQLDSFEAEVELREIGPFHAVFIRAPQLVRCGEGVEVLGCYDGVPVLVRQRNVLVSSFHPEISGDPRIHRYFAEHVCAHASLLGS